MCFVYSPYALAEVQEILYINLKISNNSRKRSLLEIK
jgi:hypothetical protein